MIIFFSSSASSISQQLRGVKTKGPIGLYNSKDERAVEQAAQLVRVNVFILNIFLVRLSIAMIITACLIMVFTSYVETSWAILFCGFMTAIASIILDSIKTQRCFTRR